MNPFLFSLYLPWFYLDIPVWEQEARAESQVRLLALARARVRERERVCPESPELAAAAGKGVDSLHTYTYSERERGRAGCAGGRKRETGFGLYCYRGCGQYTTIYTYICARERALLSRVLFSTLPFSTLSLSLRVHTYVHTLTVILGADLLFRTNEKIM